MKKLVEIYFNDKTNNYEATVNFTYKDKEAVDTLKIMMHICNSIMNDYMKSRAVEYVKSQKNIKKYRPKS